MIRKYTLLVVLVAAISSCSEDIVPPLTPDLVSILAYDLGNSGNASDIRVDFFVKNNLNVIEYRVMVVPSASSNAFDEGIAESLPVENLVIIFAESSKITYSINRLPSSLLDVNGAPITDGISYVVVVLAVGNGDQQLSEFSKPFTLID